MMDEYQASSSFFNNSYYSVSKFLNEITGQWPYQNKKKKIIPLIVSGMVISFQMIFQILAAIHWRNDSDLVIAAISPVFFDFVSILKLLNNIYHTSEMKEILDCIKKDWSTINGNEEKKILDEYAYLGKIISIGYTGLAYTTAVFYIVDPSLTYCYKKLLDSNYSMAETGLYIIPMYFNEYNVGVYYYLTVFINYFDTLALATMIVSNDTLFVIFVQHICGQFTVLGYRIKKTLSSVLNSDKQYEIINKCIVAHNELIRQSEKIESIYNRCFLFLVGLNVFLLNLTAVQLLISQKMIQTVIKFSIYMAAQVIHMCFLCTMSQQLINHSLQLSQSIYESMWYTKSLRVQKMCQLMILRSQVPCQLSAGKMIALSLENFGKIMKTTASYLTVFLGMS